MPITGHLREAIIMALVRVKEIEMAEIILAKCSGDLVRVLVDKDDFAEVSQRHWYVNAARGGSVYSIDNSSAGDGKTVYLPRMLLNAQSGEYVDHINGNPCDNRKENLRITTNQENCQNRHRAHSNSTSGIRGVSYNKGCRKWEAYYWMNYKKNNVGYFDNKEEAAAAVTLARRANMPFSEMDKIGSSYSEILTQQSDFRFSEMDKLAA